MRAIKVNADYESVLFNNKSLPIINEALESLALFLSESPLLSHKKYDGEFIDYIECLKGLRPSIVKTGSFDNWWGPLKDIELERKLNSKEMSAELNADSFIISSIEDLPDLTGGKVYLAKNPFGMSGQSFCRVEEGRLDNLKRMLTNGKVIIEPLFDRTFDFSHYVFPNGIRIAYENIVDQKFQYRGTVFNDYTKPDLDKLSFFDEISPTEWNNFEWALNKIISHYQQVNLRTGFSVDSFVYKSGDELFIRHLSEVNYRRTMGQVAFELSVKFGGLRKWSAFILAKSNHMNFSQMRECLKKIEWRIDTSRGVIILSPGDVRYNMFFLSALDKAEGKILLNELMALLPDTEFSIKF